MDFDLDLTAKVIRSNRRRTVGLIITEDAELEVRAPKKASLTSINKFINDNKSWIINKIKARKELISKYRNHTVPDDFADGNNVLYEGDAYSLKITDHDTISLFNENKILYFPRRFLPCAKQYLIIWLKHQALKKAIARVEYFSKKTKLQYNDVRITSAKGIWGSCNSKKRLVVNWRLIMAPTDVFDYIVIHEIIHLVVKNHSKLFWEKVARVIPEYKNHEDWIKKNGEILML